MKINELKGRSAKRLAITAGYFERCGYQCRDQGLAELQAVLSGERKFANLPTHV